jgi:superfamily II DNA/RNA helicase
MEATVETTTASEPETSVRDTVVTDYPGMEAAGDAAPAAGHEPQEVVPVIGDDEPHVDAAAAGEAAPQDATVVTDRHELSEEAAVASRDEPLEAVAATDGNEPQETTAAADPDEPREAAAVADKGEPRETAAATGRRKPRKAAALVNAGEPPETATSTDGNEPPEAAAEADADEPQEPAGVIPIAEGPPPEPPRAVFADLHLSDEVLRAIADMGYRHPTPIQEQAIPFVLMGRDVMGIAQTGTGKTAGFTLPMLDILAGSRARARMPRSLILEPTRELALQVAENFVQYGKYLKLNHALIIGGESMTDQKDVLMKGVDVLIATPGRLLDMFDRGSVLLSDTRILVIDEADRMLDMGFIPDVEKIVSLLPKTRQTLFFSATMGPEIRRLADAFLTNPKQIAVSRAASVATTITEGLALVAEHDKREALRRLIRSQNVQNALIFCNRKRDVDILYKSLTKHHFDAGALHGDMAQTLRFQTLEKFKAGDLRLLVCSDVAARGIDIGGLSHVFNFDVPIHAEDYVHRIGRTGRAGLEGHAFTIAEPDDRYAVEQIEKLIGHAIPPVVVEGLDPVDWAERDGRKRRGRKAPEPKKPVKARETKVREVRETKEKPTRARSDRPRAARPAPEPQVQAELPVGAERSSTRGEARREREPRREESRGEYRRDESRRYRRDDDLGPTVVGFGDDIPAFMLIRARPQATSENRESDA